MAQQKKTTNRQQTHNVDEATTHQPQLVRARKTRKTSRFWIACMDANRQQTHNVNEAATHQPQLVRARKTKKNVTLLDCMHGCKNVPSATGWCEKKARSPFPHGAMLSTGRSHGGAKKKPPAMKHVSSCSTQLWMRGYGGLFFRTNRSNNKSKSRCL